MLPSTFYHYLLDRILVLYKSIALTVDGFVIDDDSLSLSVEKMVIYIRITRPVVAIDEPTTSCLVKIKKLCLKIANIIFPKIEQLQ